MKYTCSILKLFRSFFFSLAFLFGSLLIPHSVFAQETFVQHDLDGTNNWSVGADNNAGTHYHEATFTPTEDWLIESYGIWLARGFNDTLTDDFKIEICSFDFQANSSEMCDTVLATGTIANNTLINDLTYYNLDFDQDVQTTTGTRYVVRFRRTGANSATDYPLLGKSADSPDNSNNYGDSGYPGDADVGHDYLGGYYIWDFNYSQVMPAYSLMGTVDVPELSPLLSISATGTDQVATGNPPYIGFSGNIPTSANGLEVGEVVNNVYVTVKRLLGGSNNWSQNPTNPITGRFDSGDSNAGYYEYVTGLYDVSIHVQTSLRSGSATTTTAVNVSNVFDEGSPYVSPQITDPAAGYTFSASAAEIIGPNLVITNDGCASLVDSASGIKSFVKCTGDRFQAIPPVSWIFGVYKAYYDAYTDASATDSRRVRLAITTPHGFMGGDGASQTITFLDSSSSTPYIVARVEEIFPNYYHVLELLLWVGFAFAVTEKGRTFFSRPTVAEKQV